MQRTLDFWFDFASPYSYPAAMRIESLAAGQGIHVNWRAFLLGVIFQAQGLNDSPFKVYPAKGRYMWRDMARICEAEGMAFRRPSVFPRNGLLAARLAAVHHGTPWLPAFVRAVFTANFRDDLDISDAGVIADCLTGLGENAANMLAQAHSDAARACLRTQTSEAVALGIFGAPFFVADSELFWGNHRLDQALNWVGQKSIQA